jgi:glycine hydroxymethyltransferase
VTVPTYQVLVGFQTTTGFGTPFQLDDAFYGVLDTAGRGTLGGVTFTDLTSLVLSINKNSIPNDPEKPMVTSGVRIGTPAMTTRGFKDEEARITANLIADVLDNPNDPANIEAVRAKVNALTARFPVYK